MVRRAHSSCAPNNKYLLLVPKIIDPVFSKTSPKHSFSMTEHKRFGLVFTKTRVINSGIGVRVVYIAFFTNLRIKEYRTKCIIREARFIVKKIFKMMFFISLNAGKERGHSTT
jgi:hypothetical protein